MTRPRPVVPPAASRDWAYWQRLRRDKRSAVAVLLCAAAVMIPPIAVTTFSMGNLDADGRGNPLYWLVPFPPAWWVRRLVNYEASAVRRIGAAFIIAPLAGLGVVAWSWALWLYLPIFWFVPAASLACSVAGWSVYRGSMLEREGPAR